MFRLALEGNEARITEYLLSVETEDMGFGGDKRKCRLIASMVLQEETKLKEV